MYHFLYSLMLIGFVGVSIQAPDLKGKVIGFLLAVVNGLIFWR